MKTGWFVGIAMAFVLLTIVFTVGEMTWVGSEMSPIMIVINPIKYGPSAWISGVWGLISFRYVFFSGSWILVRWILFTALAAGVMWSVGFSVLQSLASAVGGIFRAFLPR